MICGVGIDTVEIARFRAWPENSRKIARFFNREEAEYIATLHPRQRAASLAARFAAKEAFGKAAGSGLRSVRLVDIAVYRDAHGKPALKLFNSALQVVENIDMCTFHLSLAHTREYATACVVMERIQ